MNTKVVLFTDGLAEGVVAEERRAETQMTVLWFFAEMTDAVSIAG